MAIYDEASHPRPTVLVVDDDPALRDSLKLSLAIEGFSVHVYSNGAELLKEREIPRRGCLVIDYKLPDMTGLDLLAELRRRQVVLPAILITTHPSPTVRERAAIAGMQIVEKALLIESLFQCICDALAKPTFWIEPTIH